MWLNSVMSSVSSDALWRAESWPNSSICQTLPHAEQLMVLPLELIVYSLLQWAHW